MATKVSFCPFVYFKDNSAIATARLKMNYKLISTNCINSSMPIIIERDDHFRSLTFELSLDLIRFQFFTYNKHQLRSDGPCSLNCNIVTILYVWWCIICTNLWSDSLKRIIEKSVSSQDIMGRERTCKKYRRWSYVQTIGTDFELDLGSPNFPYYLLIRVYIRPAEYIARDNKVKGNFAIDYRLSCIWVKVRTFK